jgi:hypothetical protein
MSITETEIPWKNIPLRFKKNIYPVPLNDSLPRMFFVGLFVGSRGSGKSYAVCNLLKQYEQSGILDTELNIKVEQRIILLSPTIDANPVFTSLKHLDDDDNYNNYSDELLIDIIENIKYEKQETIKYNEHLRIYKKFVKAKHINELSNYEIIELELMGYEPPAECKYPNGVVNFLILDDLIGSSAFKATGKSALTNMILKNRHLGINVMICTQNLKAIPKSIRTNTSLFIIFKFASKKIVVDDLYEEVSNLMTIENFEKIYEYATKDPHDFLCIDFTQHKSQQIKMGFNKVLSFDK